MENKKKEHKNQYTIDGCVYEIKAWDPSYNAKVIQIENKEYVKYTGQNEDGWLNYIDGYEYLQTTGAWYDEELRNFQDFVDWTRNNGKFSKFDHEEDDEYYEEEE